jgi:hypothetical protein
LGEHVRVNFFLYLGKARVFYRTFHDQISFTIPMIYLFNVFSGGSV